MQIGIITYDHPHRKTQDLLCRLILMGYNNIELIILPWIERKKHVPLYQHRPADAVQLTTEELCDRLKISYQRGELKKILTENKYDKILIGGAGILPCEVLKYNIINSHPGYLPKVRGLDALKWAILNDQEIGVTTYIIGESADTGIMIDRQMLPLYYTDTFHSIANRLYELEIKMLSETIVMTPNGQQFSAHYEYPVTARMGHYDEIRMIARLNKMLSEL